MFIKDAAERKCESLYKNHKNEEETNGRICRKKNSVQPFKKLSYFQKSKQKKLSLHVHFSMPI